MPMFPSFKQIGSLLMTALLLFPFNAIATEFKQPRPGLLTSGQPSAEQLASLPAQGVHTVIDLRGQNEDRGYDEAAQARQLGLQYIALPIGGKDDLTMANAASLKALLDQQGDGVLLHCASGNRVGALLALMAVQQEGMDAEQALQLGKQAGLGSLEPVVRENLLLPASR